MVGQDPSIQSFFPPQSSPSKSLPSSSSLPGDGFTAGELEAAIQQASQDDWLPRGEYEDCDIGSLASGLQRVKLMGRVVNLLESPPTYKMPTAAKGSLQLVVKDDTGAITVRLLYARIQHKLQIGQLVTVWVTSITDGDRGMFPCMAAPLFVKIFPEKDKSCHLRVNQEEGYEACCRMPLNHETGLMALKSFVQGGYEALDAKIIVIVKSISARKKVTTKKGTTVDLVKVGVMDDTEEALLSLWGFTSASASEWKPSCTVLLISSPGLNALHKNWLSMASNTFVDVDPHVPEAAWLRKFAGRMIRRGHVNPAFPFSEYNAWSLTKPPVHALYTLADVDARAREAPEDRFEGYLSLIIMEVNMMTLRRQNMLLCNECCGIPLYANATAATCKQCDQNVALMINPRLIGKLIDESGYIASGKLVLSALAWTQLLGRSADELIESGAGLLKSVEQRMLFVRITLRFWWSEEVGKLAVFGVLE